jgi:tRNA (guanine37-N1)-methyltransferase
MRFNILTLFPEFFKSPLNQSILKRAQDENLHLDNIPVEFNVINIRDFAQDKHHMTDDRPYGGGPGMVMKVEPIDLALKSIKTIGLNSRVLLTSAKGQTFTQQKAQELSSLDEITIICGHYEGVDERVAQHLVDEEIRIGDYVLTGGEPAAIVIIDAVTRLLPLVLGNDQSIVQESHSKPGYLEHPHYTRPEDYNGWKVPEVLLSGHHGQIDDWKKDKSK